MEKIPMPDRNELQRLYDELGTQEKIADCYHVSKQTVCDWFKRSNIKIKARTKNKPSKEELQRLYDELKSSKKIAEIYKVNQKTVVNWLDDYSISKNRRGARLPENVTRPSKEELQRLYDEHGSFSAVAKVVGVSRRAIADWMKDSGLESLTLSELRLPENVTRPSKEELQRLYDEHGSFSAVAKVVGVSCSSIVNWANEYEISRTNPASEMPSKEELQRLYDELGSVAKVSKILGKGNWFLANWMRKQGVVIREQKKLPTGVNKPSKEELQRLYDELGTKKKVAMEIGASTSSIRDWMSEYEILSRSKSKYIKSDKKFMNFLDQNETARELAAAAVAANDEEAIDFQRIMHQMYPNSFKDGAALGNLIEKNREAIYELIRSGVTTLGQYIGGREGDEGGITPLVMGKLIERIGPDMNSSQEDLVYSMLKRKYESLFNRNPTKTLEGIAESMNSGSPAERKLYSRLYGYYRAVIDLEGELE